MKTYTLLFILAVGRIFATEAELQAELTKLQAELNSLEDQAAPLKVRRAALLKKMEEENPDPDYLGSSAPSGSVQYALGKDFRDFVKEHEIQIRKSSIDPSGKTKPALFQFASDSSSGDSFLADIGVLIEGASFTNDFSSNYWSGFVDFHRNDANGSDVDSFASGLEWHSHFKNKQKLFLQGAYKSDQTKTGEGVLAKAFWYPYNEALGLGGDYEPWIPGILEGRIFPYLGYEFETGDGSIAQFADGERHSLAAGVTLSMLLFPEYTGSRLELDGSVSYWHHFGRTGGYDDYTRDQLYYTVGLSFWLDSAGGMPLKSSDKHVALKVEFTSGDNPLTGKLDQELVTAGVAIQF